MGSTEITYSGIAGVILIVALFFVIWMVVKFFELCSDIRDTECHQREIISLLQEILKKMP